MRLLSLILAIALLGGCGAVYQSPQVTAGSQVEVVDITEEVVARANSSIYQPRALPSVFDVTAGTGTAPRGGGPVPEGALPLPAATPSFPTRIPEDVDPGPYLIGVSDVLELTMPAAGSANDDVSGRFAAQSAGQGYAVQDDGAINIPNVGRVQLAGMTLQQAEALLFQRFAESQVDPVFGLEISAFNARKVSVGGAVAEPAVIPVTLTPLYLNEAIARAGGMALSGQQDGVMRLYRGGTLYQIPLDQYRARADLQRLRLKDGDSLHIDADTDLTRAQAYFEQQIALAQLRAEARETALLELSTEVALRRNELKEERETFRTRADLGAIPRDYVYLMGEVAKQSRYPLPFEQQASLADALVGAGDGVPIITGDVSQIYVLRRHAGGVTAWRLDGRNAANFTLAPRFEMRPDDIIFVAEQPITRWGRVLSQLTSGSANTSFTRSLD